MKSFNYRGRQITAMQWGRDKHRWYIVLAPVQENGGFGLPLHYPQDSPASWCYNVDLDHPRSLWRRPTAIFVEERWHVRTFEQALQNCLAAIDAEEEANVRAAQHERLMEARLGLAEELTKGTT